jgi:hypothetical protein
MLTENNNYVKRVLKDEKDRDSKIALKIGTRIKINITSSGSNTAIKSVDIPSIWNYLAGT